MTLIDIVGDCEQSLGAIELGFKNLSPHVPTKVKDSWQERINLRSYLCKSVLLMKIRNIAWQAVKKMDDTDMRTTMFAKNQASSCIF